LTAIYQLISKKLRFLILQFTHKLLTVFITVFATLFPVINPLGGAPIFLNLTQECSVEVRKKLARSISINSFVMLIGAMLVGPQLLLFFGISLPVLKIAGGLVVAVMGWNILNDGSSKSSNDGNASSSITDSTAMRATFYPLTLPLTVGPGSLATMIALVVNNKKSSGFELENELSAIVGALLGICAMTLSIYFAYSEASRIKQVLGENGTNVLMRLFAFILLAIGIQIIWGGAHELLMEVIKELPAK
jgi:multiple antibiotic resistance protein